MPRPHSPRPPTVPPVTVWNEHENITGDPDRDELKGTLTKTTDEFKDTPSSIPVREY